MKQKRIHNEATDWTLGGVQRSLERAVAFFCNGGKPLPKNPERGDAALPDRCRNAPETRVGRPGGEGTREVECPPDLENGDSKLVSIRTTQDQWIAFPPKPKRKAWITLDDVEVVVAVSVDANEPPRDALVHWLPADNMRKRFDYALMARLDADRVQPDRHGVWIPLY